MARGAGKRPSYQWYPGDFRRDTAVASLPLVIRGLWREMLDLMHDGEPYGHLTAGGDAISAEDLARMVGEKPADVVRWLGVLERRAVFSRTPSGVIYSRRMVRDHATLNARINGGKGAPQPNAKGGGKGGGEGVIEGGGEGPEAPPFDPPPAVCSLQSAVCKSTSTSPDGDVSPATLTRWLADLCPSLPRVQSWTDTRKRTLRARWREHPDLGWWTEFLSRIEASDFLTGRCPPRDGHASFKADLFWCLKPDNLAKIIEGRYDNRPTTSMLGAGKTAGNAAALDAYLETLHVDGR